MGLSPSPTPAGVYSGRKERRPSTLEGEERRNGWDHSLNHSANVVGGRVKESQGVEVSAGVLNTRLNQNRSFWLVG